MQFLYGLITRKPGCLLICCLILLGWGIAAASDGGTTFDAERAWEHLLAQCSFGPRPPGSAAHSRCLEYLEKELEKVSFSVQRQPFMGIEPVTGTSYSLTNVIGRIWPERSHRILLCAHWDTRPWADQDPNPDHRSKPILGANDGASGVAILLEIARCISLRDPGIGVDIVFFDGEDMGRAGNLNEYCLGSRWYAENLSYPLPEAAVLLDLVGDADLHIPQELYSLTSSPDLLEEIFKIAEEMGEGVFDPHRGTAVYDDHVPLIQRGIRAVNLIDFDYDYWHTLQDVPANCSISSLDSVGRVLLAWIYRQAEKN